MDILDRQNGSTIIENLVALVLIGILVVLTAAFLTSISTNNNIRRSAAFSLAEREMFSTINKRILSDTVYFSENGIFKINRLTDNKTDYTDVEVNVLLEGTDEILVRLKSSIANEQK